MNIALNLLKSYKMCYLSNVLCKRHLKVLALRHVFLDINQITQIKYCLISKKLFSYSSSNITETEEVTGAYPYVESRPLTRSNIVKNILFNHNDPKSVEIGKCASVEEVFNFVRSNVDKLNYEYLAQIVLTLYDLKTIFNFHFEEKDNLEAKEIFFNKLLEHQEFFIVTKAIENTLDSFDPLFLSYTALYLNWLGVSEESELIQKMALKLRDQLLSKFSLNITSRLIRVIFTENSVRPYYIIINLIPRIFAKIEQIETLKDLEDLTVCLYELNNILTEDILNRYETKVNQLIKDKILTGADYPAILKVMSVFIFPKWRNRYCPTVSKCILLMKHSIESLNLVEMHHLYDIFLKNQEPGEALNTLQRAAAKLLHEMDENEINQTSKLKLFSSVVYFSSPVTKEQFRHSIEKYINEKETLSNIITLRKIFSSLKISDTKLCDTVWNKACQLLKTEKDFNKITKLMENYIYFSSELNGFRHYAFEHHILTIIQKHFEAGTLTLFPSRYFSALSFALLFSYNAALLNSLISRSSELSSQLNPLEVFKLSHSLQMLRQRKCLATPSHVKQIGTILHEATARFYTHSDLDPSTCGLLVKSSIIRKDYDNELINDILTSLKNSKFMSSKIMEYICFDLYTTKTLIPEVINLCTNYIIQYRDHIVGFNAEKMLSLLYQLNYQPVYEDEFFRAVTDIIIRDQERLSGLGFLQAALSLCFFNRMPKSFIKQIFNVEFLDKLDVELTHCYFKEKYPQRVRDILMQLNRAVCLEYPEYSVPWFHQKYVEEYHKTNPTDDLVGYFHRSVKGYLIGIMGKESILENIITPYGYDVNFVLHLNKDKNPTINFDDPYNTKIALLLKHEKSFTRFYERLKGEHALKNRHLEILGYKVKIIKRNEWDNLLYANERIEFIKQVVFS